MKKKNSLRKLAVMTAAVGLIAFSLAACGRKDKVNDNQDPLTGQDTTQSSVDGETTGNGENAGDFSDFDAMINDENTVPADLMGYINANIANAGEADAERLFSGILSFGSDIRNIDFTGLNDSRQYMPEDMIAFMDLMKLEADSPSMAMSDTENRKVINTTLSEMLERAALFEEHIKKYPDNVTTEAATKLYEEIATNAISGGYNRAEGIAHYYKGESDDVVNKESLKYYQQFADANAGSALADTVKEYIALLEANQFKIDDKMEEFYKGLSLKLDLSARQGNNATNSVSTISSR